MNRTSSILNVESARFYHELGELVLNVGQQHFTEGVYRLVTQLVPVSAVELSEWTVDERQGRVVDIRLMGGAGEPEDIPPPSNVRHPNEHPLAKDIIGMDHTLLIQVNARPATAGKPRSHADYHQCCLVSLKNNRRGLISLYRPLHQKNFSLTELSFLKNLSETLLPLIERHAQITRQSIQKLGTWLPNPEVENELTALQRDFKERLALCDISLSVREQEVCLGLLNGGTVPEMAEKLCVKNSSIETYLKRAAAKLGVSGRHGLAKWMVGTPMPMQA
ncbi:helix-turn-helix transcriptional regulator [Pseudomonas asplenii]|uniref:helix-turn-helix transcriptional regulator n=1 Tax=Pseudomonas asplenii TaxID=53407 RepID=UPI000379395A|nr:helix-turn-helix transcriptional regulator [Pseudomonas fuscovaginae]